MHPTLRQLAWVAAAARWLLVGQRLSQWGIGVGVGALGLALADYLLWLPGGLRLGLGVLAVGYAGYWGVTRLARAARLRPSAEHLALRAERVYPHLAGRLASAVSFALTSQRYAEPAATATTAALARQSLAGLELPEGVRLARLLRWARPAQWALGAAIVVLILLTLAAAAPTAAGIAARRWALPLGETRWPARTAVAVMGLPDVAPTDQPVKIAAVVTRGLYEGMPVRLRYRVTPQGRAAGEPSEPWQTVLMNRSTGDDDPEAGAVPGTLPGAGPGAGGRYEQLVDPAIDGPATLEVQVLSPDNQSTVQRIALAPPPAASAVVAEIAPPAYARGLVPSQRLALDQQPGEVAAAAALAGSEVTLRLTLSKPLTVTPDDLPALLPGLFGKAEGGRMKAENPDPAETSAQAAPGDISGGGGLDPEAVQLVDVSAEPRDTLTIRFRLDHTMQSRINLVDRFGLRSRSARVYRFQATPDRPPSVVLTDPAGDLSVLPTAVLDVSAVTQDDVAAAAIALQGQVQSATPSPDAEDAEQTSQPTDRDPSPGSAPSDLSLPTSTFPLARRTGRQSMLQIRHTLALADLDAAVGDRIELVAVARDGYDLDGQTHAPVRSTPRWLTVIDPATLVQQIRRDLAAVRQRALTLRQTQQHLASAPDTEQAPAARAQAELTRRIASTGEQVDQARARAEMNRLDDDTVSALIARSSELLDTAREASAAAADQVGGEKAVAAQQQEKVDAALGELIDLLDQGRDALALQLNLQQLQARQDQLAQDTRKLLPQTVGRSLENLPESVRDQLKALADRQGELGEQAEELTGQMLQAAERLDKQGGADRDKAAAAALREAAAIAQRQGLAQQMQQAKEQTDDNQLAQAGRQQGGAQFTMQQMARAVGSQQEKRQELLRRRLAKLAEVLRKLVASQKRESEALGQARDGQVAALSPGQRRLRERTIAAQVSAQDAKATAPAAEPIGSAVDRQASAVRALEEARRDAAGDAQSAAVDELERALALIQKQQDQAEEEENQQDRDQLRQAYQKLAKEQDALADRVDKLVSGPGLTRRERASLAGLGGEESELRDRAGKLGEQAADTLVFKRMHQRIDAAAGQAARQLRQRRADRGVVADQRTVARTLTAMADALDLQPPKQDFDEGAGGGGGGGGGGGASGGVVPPLAELRLMRSLQASLLGQTRALVRADDNSADASDKALADLSQRQRELGELGRQLIEQMKTRQQAPNTDGPPTR